MIYTVTFNPSLDYIVGVDEFETGKINRTCEEIIFPGGKGINVSIVLHNLGMESTPLGFVAGFTGKEIERLLGTFDIRGDFIEVKQGISRINVKLRSLECIPGESPEYASSDSDESMKESARRNRKKGTKRVKEESEINGLGPDISAAELEEFYAKLEKMEKDDVLVLAGSIPSVLPDTVYRDIMARLSKKEIRIVVDATRDLLLNVLEYHPFLVKPNNIELGEIFGVEIKEKQDVIRYAKKLQEMGARNVLISMAGDGAVLVAQDGSSYQSEAPKGKVVNSVGAGDSMVAGFLYGCLKENDYKKAFYYGLCTGSASAFSDSLATRPEVEKLLNEQFGDV